MLPLPMALDPVMRQVVGGRAVDAQAASAMQMGRFVTETLAMPKNRAALNTIRFRCRTLPLAASRQNPER